MMYILRLFIIPVLMICVTGVYALADGIIIKNGASLRINGSTLNMNCEPLTVKSGGTLTITGGNVNSANLTVESGGLFNQTGGTLDDGDVDGSDLAEFAIDFNASDLSRFASEFGKASCN